ncbi:GH11187, partial [Drosophila grimshawi]
TPNCFKLKNDTCPNSNITFWLYTKEEPLGRKLNELGYQGDSFDISKEVKVLLHGYNGSSESTPNAEVRPELLKFHNLNVISVDYGNLMREPCYAESVANLHYVGRCVAEFLGNLLYNRHVLPQKLHIIGFDIGAHLAASVSNFLRYFNLRIGRITGLDPAKPIFLKSKWSDRLHAISADFVDVIHTDVFLYGLMLPMGHADFYPNLGIVQPGCGPISESKYHKCNHQRAAIYYAESISSKTNFWSFRCGRLYNIIVGQCRPLNDFALLGYHASPRVRGSYFLGTNGTAPYALGSKFAPLIYRSLGKAFLSDFLIAKFLELGNDIKVHRLTIG